MTNQTIEQQIINGIKDQKLGNALLDYAKSLTHCLEDAEDIVQQARANVRRKRTSIQRTYPKALLCTIIKNEFINRYRTNKRHQKAVVDTDYERDKIYSRFEDNPAESIMTVENIQAEIERLDDKYKTIIKMYIAGEKYEDIAQELNLPLGTVKSRIHDAKIILQENLRQLGIVRHKRKGQTTTNSSPIQTHPQTQQTE